MKYFTILFILTLSSCNWAKNKTKQTVNKAGEVVASAGSEFVDGIQKGVERTFKNEVILSDKLKEQGIQTSKILILDSENGTNNVLSVYIIFNKDFNSSVTIKLLDDENSEYGRASQTIQGKQGEAGYFDFSFEKRTNIESKGKIYMD